jgi:hypothetical protein
MSSVAAPLMHKSPGNKPGLFHYFAICRKFRSEPPRTRTWNLEIKSLCRRSSSGCCRLQNSLKQAESKSSLLPDVSCCCFGLVSKLVSVTVSLTTARVREGPQNSLLYDCLWNSGAISAGLTLDQSVVGSNPSLPTSYYSCIVTTRQRVTRHPAGVPIRSRRNPALIGAERRWA